MTDAQKAKASAPRVPMYYDGEADFSAYRQHFVNRGGVPTTVDVAGSWSRPAMRKAWHFLDESVLISDFAR